jgi:hypothetical protein
MSIAEMQGRGTPAEAPGRIKVFSSQALRDILLSSEDKSARGDSSFSRKDTALTRGSVFPPISDSTGSGRGARSHEEVCVEVKFL